MVNAEKFARVLGNPLKQLGINPKEIWRLRQLGLSEKQQELQRNVEAYTNEVLADQPVSLLYHYWPDSQGNLFTNPSLRSIFEASSQFDRRERDGLPLVGFENVRRELFLNPGDFVLWYSPKGPASFDNESNNPYSEIKYDYGQLYIQYFDRQQGKINVLAVKISNESVLKQISPKLYDLMQEPNEEKRIKNLLLNHDVLSIGDLFLNDWSNEEVYKDKRGGPHFLNEIIKDIRDKFNGVKKPVQCSTLDLHTNRLHEFEQTEQFVLNAYLQAIRSYLYSQGQTKINLSGSCGGTLQTLSEIEGLLTSNNLPITPIESLLGIHGSLDRLIKEKINYFTCPSCHQRFQPPVGNCCPGCGMTKDEWAKTHPVC